MYLNLLLLLIFFVCVAMLFNSGIWGSTIALFNVIISALLAVSFFEPVADFLETRGDSTYTYCWDFVAVWAVFAICMAIFRAATDVLSRVKVRFKRPFDLAGGLFFSAWVGWVMVCFTLMTLHTAPLRRNFLDGNFQRTPETRMFFGLAPDRRWLGFVQKESLGALRRGGPPQNPNAHMFDPRGEYILKYGERRAKLEREPTIRVRKR